MIDKLTGAKIGKKVVGLTLAISLGSFGAGAILRNNADLSNDIDFTTRIEQTVFGSEIALQHLALDLEKQGAKNVHYYDSAVIDTLPSGYLYIDGKGVTFRNTISNKEMVDGREVVVHQIPEGYTETTTKTGEQVGIKTIEPKKIQVGNCVTFDMDKDGKSTKETWVWDDTIHDFQKYVLTTSVDEDVVTYCNKDSISSANYIYLASTYDKTDVARFSEQTLNDNSISEIDGKEYIADRVVTFYSNEKVNVLANKFAGHLNVGERMVFQNQENGVTTFIVYKQLVKEQGSKIL